MADVANDPDQAPETAYAAPLKDLLPGTALPVPPVPWAPPPPPPPQQQRHLLPPPPPVVAQAVLPPRPYAIESAAAHAAATEAARRLHGVGAEGGGRIASLWRRWTSAAASAAGNNGSVASRATKALARALICAHFINVAFSRFQEWRHFSSNPEQLASMRRWSSEPVPPAPGFPWLAVALLLPAALAEIAAPRIWAAALLLGYTAWQDGGMVVLQLRSILLYGSRPTELLAKPLAIVGTTALLLAVSVSEARRRRMGGAWAGPLRTGDDYHRETEGEGQGQCSSSTAADTAAPFTASAAAFMLEHGRAQGGVVMRARRLLRRLAGGRRVRRSALLLAGRLLMAGLLAFLGWMQWQRVRARGGGAAAALWPTSSPAAGPPGSPQHFGRADPRDNPLVLLQTFLGALVALGVATRPAAAGLSLALVSEAFLYWRFWGTAPNMLHSAHLRERFFTSLALAGGSLLLATLGPGTFAVDAIAAARKRQ